MPNDSAAMKKFSELLSELLAAYGRPRTEEAISAYAIALGHLGERHLTLAFEETLRSHRTSFMPTPGEILGYLDRAIAESRPVGPLARPDCPKCWGTGYTIIELKNSSYAVAARCSCLAASAKDGARAN